MTSYDVAEGLEDALSVWLLNRQRPVIGLPGIGALQHLGLKKDDSVLVWKDGDEEGSPAAKGLTIGSDILQLDGVSVRVTRTPTGEDVNIILQSQGATGLRALGTQTYEPTISYFGRIIGLSRIDPKKDREKYAATRAEIHKIFKVPVKDIDEDLKEYRPRPPGSPPDDDDGSPGGYEAPSDPEWEGDVNLAQALDTMVAAAQRFLKAPVYVYYTTALWGALSYLVPNEEIDLPIAPQLGFQSVTEGSGKSIAVEIVSTVSLRGYLRSSYTASTLFRRINQDLVTPCLSEYHNILNDKDKGLLAIVNACHRRAEAFVDRTETDAQTGKRYVVSYRCWAPLSWGAIGAVPREAQSRSIILVLQAALPEESHALDHSSPSQDSTLIDVRRQFTKWATGIKKLPTPAMPKSLFNRAADNFRPLFAIAELAGGDWPERIKAAAEAISKTERVPSLQVRLLTGIRDAFAAAEAEEREAARKENREAKWEDRLPTPDLIDRLCNDEEDGWQEAHHGKRINEYWLRESLRGLIDPPKRVSGGILEPIKVALRPEAIT